MISCLGPFSQHYVGVFRAWFRPVRYAENTINKVFLKKLILVFDYVVRGAYNPFTFGAYERRGQQETEGIQGTAALIDN